MNQCRRPAACCRIVSFVVLSLVLGLQSSAATAASSPRNGIVFLDAVAPELTTPATSNLAANQVTLTLQSSKDGTGYFTLLTEGATAGNGTQTVAGTDGSGTAAFRRGSLALTADTAATYIVRNLTADTTYTVCFTAVDASSNVQETPATITFTTSSAVALNHPGWQAVGSARFTEAKINWPDIEVAPDGTPTIAFSDYSLSTKATVLAFDGTSWAAVGAAGLSASGADGVDLALAPDGTWYLSYQDGAYSNRATVMRLNASTWETVGSVGFSVSGSYAYWPTLAFAPDGTPYLVYVDYGLGNRPTVMRFDGTTWNTVGELSSTAANCGKATCSFAPDGALYIAFSDPAAVVMKYDGSDWVTVGSGDASSGSAENPTLAFAPDGTLYVAYTDLANGNKANVVKLVGTAWEVVGSAGFSSSYAYEVSPAFAPDGSLHVAFVSQAYESKIEVMRFNGTAWESVGTPGFSDGAVVKPRIAFAPDGTAYVAFADRVDSDKATVMKFASDTTPPDAPTSLDLDEDTISGTAEAGATIEIFLDSTSIGTTTADESGAWSITLDEAVTDGDYTVTATATDAAGNTGSASAGTTVTLERMPPQVVSITRQDPETYYTQSGSVTFRVTFSEPVSGVDIGDFTLDTSNGEGSLGNLTAQSTSVYDVRVYFWDIGELGLILNSSNTGIADAVDNAIASGFTASERYFYLYSPHLYTDTGWGDTVVIGTSAEVSFEIEALPDTVEVIDLPDWATFEWEMVEGESYAVGVISGTPTTIGTWTMTIRATNTVGEETEEVVIEAQEPPTALSIVGVHTFIRYSDAEDPDGYRPTSGLVEHEGWFYGTTAAGGNDYCGIVYRLQVDDAGQQSAYEIVHHFSETDGDSPESRLLVHGGWLYGTTQYGGPNGYGVIFRLRVQEDVADFEVLHECASGAEQYPVSELIAQGEWLYGISRGNWSDEDDANIGAIFRIRPDDSDFEIVHTFDPAKEGESPESGLLACDDGYLYGTLPEDGPSDGGIIYRYSPATDTFEVLHAFDLDLDEGTAPTGRLTEGGDGWLYGSTSGLESAATVFRIKPDGSELQVLKRFSPASIQYLSTIGDDTPQSSGISVTKVGAAIYPELLKGSDDLLYGVSYVGGTEGCGFVFALTMDGGAYEVVAHLDGISTGMKPMGALCEGSDGRLYGTSYASLSSSSDKSLSVRAQESESQLISPLIDTPSARGAVFVVTLPHPAITSSLEAEAVEGEAFSYTITATDEPTLFTAIGLPGGLTVDPTTGVISGTPTETETFDVELTVARGLHTDTATLNLVVSSAGPKAYFGTFNGSEGSVAAYLLPTGAGTLIGQTGATGAGFLMHFTLGEDGTFSGSATPIPSAQGASPARITSTKDIAGDTYTITGTLVGGVLSGTIAELGLSFSATVDGTSGTGTATYFAASALDTLGGEIHTIVGPSGQIFALVLVDGTSRSGSGTLLEDGSFEIELDQGGSVNATLGADAMQALLATTDDVTIDFSGAEATADATHDVVNLSSRGNTGTGENITIAGFIITGTESKQLLLRVVGPTLAHFGVENPASDPTMCVYDSAGNPLSACDDWSGSEVAAAATSTGAFDLAEGSKDAALVIDLPPGAYTVHASSKDSSGVVLAEVYDVDPDNNASRLANISVRGRVQSGENVLIGGFIVSGNTPKRVLVRAVGPTLAGFGITDPLADPSVLLFDAANALVATNDDWEVPTAIRDGQTAATATQISDAATEVSAFALPTGSTDAAILINLAPGIYTVHARSKDDSTGVALIEVYELTD